MKIITPSRAVQKCVLSRHVVNSKVTKLNVLPKYVTSARNFPRFSSAKTVWPKANVRPLAAIGKPKWRAEIIWKSEAVESLRIAEFENVAVAMEIE